jgi:transposase InsO family protein
MRIEPGKIIKTLIRNEHNVELTSKQLGIHRSTVYRWIKRARTTFGYKNYLKQANLKRCSTRPKTIHYALSNKKRLEVFKLREKTGYTAVKIKKILGLKVSYKTVHRFLKNKGLVRKTTKYKRPRFQDTLHMHASNTKTVGYLQMDVKHITPELSGLPWTCYEYGVIDIFSRYKEAVILNQIDQDGAILSLMEIVKKLPFKPVFIQTDNGLEFQKRFKKYVTNIGLKYHYIHKRSPNENALIERSFRTDEEEFFFRLEDRPTNYDNLKELFAGYLHTYNHVRPHLGINLATPAEIVANVVSH